MQNNSYFQFKDFEINQSYIQTLLIIFTAAILAKGAVIFRGFALDDYSLAFGVKEGDIGNVMAQGRYISAGMFWLLNTLHVNLNDMYFACGITTLLLYSAFIMSLFRFVGVDKAPTAGLIGAIMIAHPYLTEILTFRMSLFPMSAILIFSIIALEMITQNPKSWHTRIFALLATLGIVFSNQSFLNYFAVAIIFAFIVGQVFNNSQSLLVSNNDYRERIITLMIISILSVIAAITLNRAFRAIGLIGITNRTNFITIDEIPKRIEQITSSLIWIYWKNEPIFSGWLKTLVAIMLVSSVITFFWYLLTDKNHDHRFRKILFSAVAFSLLIPTSLGIIIALTDWWPVPRVVAHVAIITGFTLLLADLCIQKLGNHILKLASVTANSIVLIGFVLLSNQIFADQQRINQWDRMLANRIIARLEMQPNFNNVKFVHISSHWTSEYPAMFRTRQGDMNRSALSVSYSRVGMLVDVAGYNFELATGNKAIVGEKYCATKQPWPNVESITIDGDLAIVCLKK